MKKSNISFGEFCDSFSDSYKNNFSYAGKEALYDYFENLENDTGEELELDTVALCCDYSEYESAWDAMKEYQPEDMPCECEEGDDLVEIQAKNETAAHEWLDERTIVIDVEGGHVIIAAF